MSDYQGKFFVEDGVETIGQDIEDVVYEGEEVPDEIDPDAQGSVEMDDAPEPQVGAPSTQVEHPWRASIRTATIAFFGFLVALAPFIGDLSRLVQEDLGLLLPVEAVGAIVGFLGVISVIVGFLNRLALVPSLNALLTSIGFGPKPKGE